MPKPNDDKPDHPEITYRMTLAGAAVIQEYRDVIDSFMLAEMVYAAMLEAEQTGDSD